MALNEEERRKISQMSYEIAVLSTSIECPSCKSTDVSGIGNKVLPNEQMSMANSQLSNPYMGLLNLGKLAAMRYCSSAYKCNKCQRSFRKWELPSL